MATQQILNADVDVDGCDRDRVPGVLLMAFLLQVAAAFILPANKAGEHAADHCLRISPYACVHDTIERVVEFGLRYRYPAQTSEKDMQMDEEDTQHDTTPTYDSSWTPRLLGALSFLCLWTVRNAGWTQLFAALYVLHWAVVTVLPTPRPRTAEADHEIRRLSSVLFATLVHVTFYSTASTGAAPSNLVLALTNGTLLALASVLTDPSPIPAFPNGLGNNNLEALLGQSFSILMTCSAWVFAFSPGAWLHKPVGESASDYDKLVDGMFPVLWFLVAAVAFCVSLRSLSLAHPGVKMVVAALWMGAGGLYYLWMYEHFVIQGVPTAEFPSVVGLKKWVLG